MHQRGERVVVTGGAGFIGSHLVDRLLADTWAEVVVLDNFTRGGLSNLAAHVHEPRLSIIKGDIRDVRRVQQALDGARIVYHLAAQSTVLGAMDDLEDNFGSNVTGTFNVLQAASQLGVERLVFASSREVYGEPVELPVDEGQPLLAINFYGASKVVGEAYCRAFRRASRLDTVVLRMGNVYGPRDFGRVIPVWLKQASAGQDLEVYGGKQVLDFIWVGQVVEALVRAGAADGSLPAINVANGVGTRLVDLARRIMLLVGRGGHVKIAPARPIEVVRFVASIQRMRELLRIEPALDPLAEIPKLVSSPALLTAL